MAVDSVKLVRAVVVLVGLKWQHLQGYLGSRPRLMESSVEKTVPVADWRCLWLQLHSLEPDALCW